MNTKLKVGIIIENEDSSKILLIKEKLQKKEKPLWNLIKGSYEKADSSLLETAKRECLEEIGVKINLNYILAIYFSQKADKNRIQITFIATIKEGKPTLSSNKKQKELKECILEFKWFDKKQICSLKEAFFVNKRAFLMTNDWSNGQRFPLESYQEIET